MATLSASREDLAWAAGFFDGEGSTSHAARKQKGRVGPPRVCISQNERDTLERFQDAIGGLGSIYPRKGGDWEFSAQKFSDAQAIIAQLWNWLGPHKRGQYHRVFLRWRNQAPLRRTTDGPNGERRFITVDE